MAITRCLQQSRPGRNLIYFHQYLYAMAEPGALQTVNDIAISSIYFMIPVEWKPGNLSIFLFLFPGCARQPVIRKSIEK